MNLDEILERSYSRLTRRIPSGEVICPFCGREMQVRRSSMGIVWKGEEDVFIDGLQMKCVGEDGCAFRPDFDVPIQEGSGYWPSLSGEEEYNREIVLRDGQTAVDAASDGADESEVVERLSALGYI